MSSPVNPSPAVLPICWWNLPLWAAKTFSNSIYFRRKPARPLSFTRLRQSLFPELRQPIFIVGAARSGTSFLGHCFNAFPEISFHYEPVATKAAVRYVYENRWSREKAARFFRLVYGWLMRIYLDGDLRFADKTPRNSFVIDFLSEAFPDSQFIHIIRDGRGAALSLRKKPWLSAAGAREGKYEPGGYQQGPYPRFWVPVERRGEFFTTSDTHRCIWAWKSAVEAALAGAQKLPPTRYHELRYETLGFDPNLEADRISAFLGITSQASKRKFQLALAGFRPDSLHTWKDELTAEDLQIIDQEAGALLQRLGYIK